MKVFKGHDPSLGDEGTDLLLTIHDDETAELATRPGLDQTWLTWGPPVSVEDVSDPGNGCGCYACIGDKPAHNGTWLTVGMTRMIVCATCGNKRCPHGTDHRNECTGSNEPEQAGSRYGGLS